MSEKFIILLHGPMGSGKTTTSTSLHQQICPSARIALPDIRRIVSGDNHKNGNLAREVMLRMADSYLSENVPVIVETVCKEDSVKNYKALAEKHRCELYAFLISADEEIRFERVCERTKQMMGADILPSEKVEELQRYFEENDTFYQQESSELCTILNTDNKTRSQVVDLILTRVGNIQV